MGSWVTASIFVASIVWLQGEANPALLQAPFLQQWQLGTWGKAFAQPHSASTPETHKGTIDVSTRRVAKEEKAENTYLRPVAERYAVVEQPEDGAAYHDQKASQTTEYLEPYQLDIGEDDQYYKIQPQHEFSEVQSSYGHEQHGEVHYHQHKHVHKHEHKQEHKHQHKNEHKHDHMHKQEHKHSHHSGHKHEHGHKHDHHEGHKHDEHHEHKHGHHHKHKHGHHHGHKHQHHSQHKHKHHHGHKHGHKHGHHHSHKHQHSKHH